MPIPVQYGTSYEFPDAQVDGEDFHELRRYVKDLSFFRTAHFVKPGFVIQNADLVGTTYNVQPDQHLVMMEISGAGVYSVDLPDPAFADAAIYTVLRRNAVGFFIIGNQGSGNIQGGGGVNLNTSIVAAPNFSMSFVHDGVNWWRIT